MGILKAPLPRSASQYSGCLAGRCSKGEGLPSWFWELVFSNWVMTDYLELQKNGMVWCLFAFVWCKNCALISWLIIYLIYTTYIILYLILHKKLLHFPPQAAFPGSQPWAKTSPDDSPGSRVGSVLIIRLLPKPGGTGNHVPECKPKQCWAWDVAEFPKWNLESWSRAQQINVFSLDAVEVLILPHSRVITISSDLEKKQKSRTFQGWI